jgi:butyrate kinase
VKALTASDTVSANGQIIRRVITGTYTVNDDCTGTVAFTDQFGLTTH